MDNKQLEKRVEKTAKYINDKKKLENKKSIYIYGNSSIDKTKILNFFFENTKSNFHKKSLKMNVSEMFDKLLLKQYKQGSHLYKLEDYKKYDLLFLDDLGVKKYSEFQEEILYKIIDYRWKNNLTTIITSNLSPDELAKKYTQKVSSRIVEMCYIAKLTDEDNSDKLYKKLF